MQAENSVELQFELNFIFSENKNAVEVLDQMLKFYDILNDFDKSLVRNVSPTLFSEYVLSDIEYGSLRSKLLQVIKGIPDELLKDFQVKKLIGFFLVKAKYYLIKKLSVEKDISSKEQVQAFTDEVNKGLTEIGEKQSIIVNQITNYVIINVIYELSQQVNEMKDRELLEYKSTAGNSFIQKGLYVNKAKILSELGQQTIINETTEILKVKKIEMLSDTTKWEFLQGKKIIKAKVSDKEWLDSFHNREVSIMPEDALMVTLKTTHNYTPNFTDKTTYFEVIKVLSIINPESGSGSQLRMEG